LLDSGPAINAYRVSGDLGEKGEGNGTDEPQPDGAVLKEESELVAEPLDPEDDLAGSEEIS
jgi:hypothetical protein